MHKIPILMTIPTRSSLPELQKTYYVYNSQWYLDQLPYIHEDCQPCLTNNLYICTVFSPKKRFNEFIDIHMGNTIEEDAIPTCPRRSVQYTTGQTDSSMIAPFCDCEDAFFLCLCFYSSLADTGMEEALVFFVTENDGNRSKLRNKPLVRLFRELMDMSKMQVSVRRCHLSWNRFWKLTILQRESERNLPQEWSHFLLREAKRNRNWNGFAELPFPSPDTKSSRNKHEAEPGKCTKQVLDHGGRKKDWAQFFAQARPSEGYIGPDHLNQSLCSRIVKVNGKAKRYLLKDVFKGEVRDEPIFRQRSLDPVCRSRIQPQGGTKAGQYEVQGSLIKVQTKADLNETQHNICSFGRLFLDIPLVKRLCTLMLLVSGVTWISCQLDHLVLTEQPTVLKLSKIKSELICNILEYTAILLLIMILAVLWPVIFALANKTTTLTELKVYKTKDSSSGIVYNTTGTLLDTQKQDRSFSKKVSNFPDAYKNISIPDSNVGSSKSKRKWYLSWFKEGVTKLHTNYTIYPATASGSLERYFEQKYHGSGVPEDDEMRYEWLRLKTFEKWPQWAIPYPFQLAKAGFYYTKERDKVTCFSCFVVVQDWKENMSPMEMHKSLYPNCKFLAGMEDNFPIPEPDRSSPIVNEVLSRTPNGPVITGMQSSDSGMPEVNSFRISAATSDSNVAQATRTNTLDSGFSDSIRANGSMSSVGSVVQDSSGQAYRIETSSLATTEGTLSGTFLERMKHEHNRYLTYRTWPTGNINQAKLLAKAGLYYSGLGHKVKCAFCDGTLDYTDPDQAPMTCHTRLYPSCPFVRSQNTGNVPSYPNPASAPPQQPPPTRQSQSDLASLGIMSDSPKHPEYSLLQSRINSFRGWSPEREQKPYDLAVAGFLYAGMSDCVKCFHCDGGLRNWLSGDIPWVEHARWYPHCSYVRLCKGQEFIDTIDQQYPRLSAQNTAPGSTTATAAAAALVDPEVIELLLSSPSVQSVLEMGYTKEFVKKGVEMYIQQKGHDKAIDAQSLVEILLEMQSNGGDSLLGNVDEQSLVSQLNDLALKNQTSRDNCLVCVDHSDPGHELDTNSLREKNRELIEQTLCKICLENKMCITFLPCGHLVSCAECAPALRKCPICRSNIKGRVRVYMS